MIAFVFTPKDVRDPFGGRGVCIIPCEFVREQNQGGMLSDSFEKFSKQTQEIVFLGVNIPVDLGEKSEKGKLIGENDWGLGDVPDKVSQ